MALRSFVVPFVLVAAALAQSSSTNPFIPSDISANCSTYLTSLNDAFSSCTTPFITALQAFAPGANPSPSAISAALSALCSSNVLASCPQNTVSTQLSSFQAACQAELTSSPNQVVKTSYDSMYALIPLGQAVCAKDDSGNYCAAQLSSSNSTALDNSQKQALQSYLTIPESTGPNGSTTSVFNATTYQDTNLVFFFLGASLSSGDLCTTCTRGIMSPYISFESQVPHASGLNNSVLFAGQSAIYTNMLSQCPTGFLSGVVAAAGGLSSGIGSSAASRLVPNEPSAAVGAILGAVALVVAASF